MKLIACFLLSLSSNLFAQNVWELRDRNNVVRATMTSTYDIDLPAKVSVATGTFSNSVKIGDSLPPRGALDVQDSANSGVSHAYLGNYRLDFDTSATNSILLGVSISSEGAGGENASQGSLDIYSQNWGGPTFNLAQAVANDSWSSLFVLEGNDPAYGFFNWGGALLLFQAYPQGEGVATGSYINGSGLVITTVSPSTPTIAGPAPIYFSPDGATNTRISNKNSGLSNLFAADGSSVAIGYPLSTGSAGAMLDVNGTLKVVSNAVINGTLNAASTTVTGTLNVSSSVTAGSFIGSGSGLTGTANGLIVGTANNFSGGPVISTTSPSNASGINTSFSGCISGSTVTISLANSGPVEVSFVGVSSNSLTSDGVSLVFLQDGSFVGSYSATTAVITVDETTASQPMNSSFSYLIPSVASGAHSYCLGAWSNGGGTWQLVNGSISVPQFSARVVH